MQTDIDALIIFNVDGNFLDQTQRFSIEGLELFEVGRDHVIGVAGRNALGKLSDVIGIKLPFGLLVASAANLDLHAIDGMIVRPPHGPENKSIGLVGSKLRSCSGSGRAEHFETEHSETREEQKKRQGKA